MLSGCSRDQGAARKRAVVRSQGNYDREDRVRRSVDCTDLQAANLSSILRLPPLVSTCADGEDKRSGPMSAHGSRGAYH